MPATSPAEVSTLVQDAMKAAMGEFIDDLADDLQDGLNTPYPPASKPGEKPHRRSGKLHNSVRDTVTAEGPHTIGEVATDTGYAGYLEEGTARMAARPHIEPLRQQAESEAATKLIDLFVTHF